jgi:hypothetical protein
MCVLRGFSWIETSLKPRRGFGFQLGFTSPETYQLLLVQDIKEEVSRFQREQVYRSPARRAAALEVEFSLPRWGRGDDGFSGWLFVR